MLIPFLMRICRQKKIVLPKSPLLLILIFLPAAAILTVPYAVDSGLAVMGFVKFLPLSIWILLMATEIQREKILSAVPYIAAAITAAGIFAGLTPLRDWFYINNRFSGTYQYANGFALLLLLALIVLLWENFGKIRTAILSCILLTGIIATGCRAVFLLTVLTVLVWILSGRKEWKQKKWIIGFLLLIVAASVILGAVTGHFYQFARFTRFSITSSSLSGRLLYNLDGLNILRNHPMGLGYKGYSFYQGAVQTGNYAVTYVHNELLQAALDFGILPAVLLGFGWIRAITGKKVTMRNRMLLLAAGLHGLFDWSLQFPATLMILCLAADWDERFEFSFHGAKRVLPGILSGVSVILVLWLGTASVLEYAGKYEAAVKVDPYLTTSQMRLINDASSDEEKYRNAEAICSRNDYCTIALQAMAEKSAREMDFEKMAEYGERAVRSSRYNSTGYELYLYLLSYAVDNCSQQGDQERALHYLQKAADLSDIIQAVADSTSPYAKNLYDKPEIKLDDAYEEYMNQAKNLMEGRKVE
ncbi:MAG: O-antigen ligase family protein [Anaerovoracaceae bacterium]